jgi:mono/diheme cytochrome c family protein
MIMKRLVWVGAFGCLVCCGTEAFAQEPGDIAGGRRLAQQWCSECHQIGAARGSADPEAEAPSFGEVANDPSTTPLSLRVFFQSNHENMPNVHISQSQADDLAAYILSLKQK